MLTSLCNSIRHIFHQSQFLGVTLNFEKVFDSVWSKRSSNYENNLQIKPLKLSLPSALQHLQTWNTPNKKPRNVKVQMEKIGWRKMSFINRKDDYHLFTGYFPIFFLMIKARSAVKHNTSVSSRNGQG